MTVINLTSSFVGRQQLAVRLASQQRQRSVAARADRQGIWLPGISAPKWLDGSMPGDRGFGQPQLESGSGCCNLIVHLLTVAAPLQTL